MSQPTVVRTYRGYEITTDGTTFYAAGAKFNTAWSAITYIDELLSP